jgi:hypothetical protein
MNLERNLHEEKKTILYRLRHRSRDARNIPVDDEAFASR